MSADATTTPTARALVSAWAGLPDRAVIFDFNGTLSNDEPILEAIFGEVFAQHLGWTMSTDQYRRELLGRSDREIVQIVQIAVHSHGQSDPGNVDAMLSLRRALYKRAVAERSPITPEAAELVRRFVAAGVPLAIVTGAQLEDVRTVIDHCAIGELITHLVTEEDVEQGKPHPEGFLKGAALLDVDPADVLVFEDSVWGVQAAHRAGMRCIAVTGPNPSSALLSEATAAISSLNTDVLADTTI